MQRRLNYEKLYSGEDNFGASNGWLDRFTSLHGLTLRSMISVGQEVPSNTKDLAENFLKYVKETRDVKGFELKSIGNMDETPLWFDLPSSRTFEEKTQVHCCFSYNGRWL